MKLGYTEITLKNADDVVSAEGGILDHDEVRQITVPAMVDTGAVTLVISEKLCEELGLKIEDECQSILPNCPKETVKMADPVKLHWKGRDIICRPMVASSNDILLGEVPLDDLNIQVDLSCRKLLFVGDRRG